MMGFSLVVFVVTQAQQPSTKENPQQPTAATLAQLAQQNAGLRRIQAFRLTETIKIDGLLNEPAWSHAQPATDFLQERPIEGALASERTEVRVLFDDKNVYFGVRAFDSDTCRYQKTRFGQQDCKRQQFNASRRCDHHHTLPQHEVTARGNSR